MKYLDLIEPIFLRIPIGILSRFRVLFFRVLGMSLGNKNRFERGRIRKISQISIGDNNAFSIGWCLWPEESRSSTFRIKIGSNNYFNRNLMVDSCNCIEIGDHNMIGPDVYITDSNHQVEFGVYPSKLPMVKGQVTIGNGCWIGAKSIILKDVHLGDYCIVGAGAVVTHSFPEGSIIAGVPAKLIGSKKIAKI